MSRRAIAAVLALLPLLASTAVAGPITLERIPEALRPWTPWVLAGHEEELCPFLDGSEERRCLWPGRLSLDLDERGGRFTQSWTVYAAGKVPLPGEERLWPQDLQVDGRPSAALADHGAPVVPLTAGSHTVAGSFRWDGLPEALQVPSSIGLVLLTVGRGPVPFPERSATGRLYLQRSRTSRAEEDRLQIAVERRLVDEVPFEAVTRIELSVSGREREVVLAPPLLTGFLPLSLTSPLPARLEPDGRLRVQVRPGAWTIELAARHAGGPVTALGPSAPAGLWADEEIWVFEARPRLRLVDLAGAPAVDPQQTRLPDDWKKLPAYRLRPGDVLRLAERRRGDVPPAADRLHLRRTLWLDFDGSGYTFQDQLSGGLHGSRRLEMASPTRLERVVVGGKDQVVTREPGATRAGIEVRQGVVDLEAEGRIEGGIFAFPAVGWDRDFEAMQGELHLPPGWTILAATGVDEVPESWVARWTLLDLFLVLVIALSVRQLWGNRWGLLALTALVLTWQEAGAPTWEWLVVLAAAALLRLLPAGRARTLVRLLSLAAAVILVLVTVAFLVQNLRQAIFPALEHPEVAVGEPEMLAGHPLIPKVQASRAAGGKAELQGRLAALGYLGSGPPAYGEPAGVAARRQLDELDPTAIVTTGPGLPRWRWNGVELRWDGPIQRSQRLRLLLLPPAANFLLALLRLALLTLLLLRVLPLPGGGGALRLPGWRLLDRRPPLSILSLVAPVLLVLSGLLAASPRAARAEVPSQEVLDQLRDGLLAKPDCHPECAASPRLILELAPAALRVRLEVGAAAAVAVPLPGGAQQWLPSQVLVDGKPPAGLVLGGDGRLWLQLAPGRHEILLEGPLPQRDAVVLPLPLKPHRVETAGGGWTVSGVHEDGVPDDSLQLTRAASGARAASATALTPSALPPFLVVERTLHLGLLWRVETRVVRKSPAGTPAAVEVPLLAGESVTSSGVRVAQRKVLVSIGPQSSEFAWASDLAVAPRIDLSAPRTLAWTEIWRLDAAALWHVAAAGIPPVVAADDQQERTPEWHPWPGERVALTISRPPGVGGATVTIDRSELALAPGARSTSTTLEIELRSSRGGQEVVTLPAGAVLESAVLGGAVLPLRLEGRRVTLPISPGAQKVALSWREPRGSGWFFRTSLVDLGAESVNSSIVVQVPASRWVLLTGGPRLGPAVLFWGLLLVLLLVAAGLGRLGLAPLRIRDWFLLGIGLSQIPLAAAAAVMGFLLAVGWRRTKGAGIKRPFAFDLLQILLAVWGMAALVILFLAVREGLLGLPEMQIGGNASSASALRWFADRVGSTLPSAWFISLPMGCYRLAMLAWALWLAISLLGWLRWVWQSLNVSGGWRRLWRARAPAAGPAAP
ncbi:MAG TPA: hypothetical protein VHG32_13095 [Thermoanaerobaculia bacterium]|nr:hypothetical protein [Thermoanaerobaculia bacterium]